MATIKGQNLRLMLNNKCVGASKTATIHAAVQVEDVSTKDTEGDFAENEPVGLTWDASVDALVTNGREDETTVTMTEQRSMGGGTIYASTTAFKLKPGCSITAVNGETQLLVFSGTTVYASGNGIVTTTNNGSTTLTVYVAADENNATATVYTADEYTLTAAQIEAFMLAKTLLTVVFSTTDGTHNRDVDTRMVAGQAYITDFSVSASNRAVSTYTCQLTGEGELSIVE